MPRTLHDVAIVGAYATPVTKKGGLPLRHLFAKAAIGTLKDAGLRPADVDGLITTPPGINPDIVIMFGAFLGKYLGFKSRILEVVENGGTTSALALRTAANEIATGRVKRCIVLAADERARLGDMTDMNYTLRFGAYSNIGLQGAYDGAYGGGFPVPFYAMSGQRYMHEYGATPEDFARVVVQLRSHAARHPGAEFRDPTTVEEVLKSPLQSPPLTLHMCCPVSTAGAGVLLTTVEEAKKMGRPFVRIAGIGGYHEPEHFLPVSPERDFTTYRSAVEASKQAYEEAGVGPKDIDVAEVYGVFAPSELMLYEDLGFVSKKGMAAQAVKDGKLTFGGDLVINPTGGRICFGHPAAATPLLETIEIVHQLRGSASGRQVENARWGLTHAEHGCMNGSSVMVYEGVRA
ncbi:MAG: thiolase family protein [Bdellovibrionota bacterium]